MITWTSCRGRSRTENETLRQGSTILTTQEQGFSRISVELDGRVGQAFRLGDAAALPAAEGLLLDEALAELYDGASRSTPDRPVRNPPAGETLIAPDMAAVPWLDEVGYDMLRVASHGATSTGKRFTAERNEVWAVQGRGGHRFSRVPDTAGLDLLHAEPRSNAAALLLPPWQLSQLFLQSLLDCVQGVSRRRPPLATLFDPAWGAGVDTEGVRRRPMVFAAGGKSLAVAVDKRSGARSGLASTGHGGIAGPHVRDLVVADENRRAVDPAVAADIVYSVVVLSDPGPELSMVVALRSDASGERSRLVFVDDLIELLNEGLWWGPYQRGAGAWTSR